MGTFDYKSESGPPVVAPPDATAQDPADGGFPRRAEILPGVDVLCLSHLRWNFVFQRPQHLLSRRATQGRVYFFEEPVLTDDTDASLEIQLSPEGVHIAVPRIPRGLSLHDSDATQRELLDGLMAEHQIRDYVLWVYTPMALGFARHLQPAAVVYDCMDELSSFRGASPRLREREQDLFHWADVVFTGGRSLYEAKRQQHESVLLFPSSIDVPHFAKARDAQPEPPDQASIPHPRLGFAGVIDERLDRELLAGLAQARPDWHFVMVGPVAKIDRADLPQAPNIHYLGGKQYSELPAYLSGWDVALLLFAHNESTRYISPTKTPEYLAAGRPVVSTSIRDVVRPYGELGLVQVADSVGEFVAAAERALREADDPDWLARVSSFLSTNSWDRTYAEMFSHIAKSIASKQPAGTACSPSAGEPLLVTD